MKINIIANHLRAQQGERLTIEMLKAELKETKGLKPSTISAKVAKRQHIASLEAMINYRSNHLK